VANEIQLFHRIADLDSARVRRLGIDMKIQALEFRNLDISESAAGELRAGIGRVEVPVVKDPEGRWHIGFQQIESYFLGLKRV